MRCRTASEECASPPPFDAEMAEVKKYLSSKMPRGVDMYLLEVTRLTVDSCMEMASATVLRLSGFRCSTPCVQEAVLLAHDLLGDAQDGARALVEALHQPVGALQALEQVALVLRRARGLGDGGVVAAVDEHARQRVGVELHRSSCRRGPGRTSTSGRTGWICTEPNFRPGLGLSRLISVIISTSSSCVDADGAAQRRQVVAAEQAQVVEQPGDLRVVAVARP